MRKCKIDNRKVIAPNSSLIGFSTNTVKAGDCFTYSDGSYNYVARSLGRIAWCDNDGAPVTGFVVAMVLSSDAQHAYERWIDPRDITSVYKTAPSKLAAFFFASELPYSPEMIRRLMAYGTVSEFYVDKAAHHVAAWEQGKSPAAA